MGHKLQKSSHGNRHSAGASPPCAAISGVRGRRTAPSGRAPGWCPAAGTGPAAARTASAPLPSAHTRQQPSSHSVAVNAAPDVPCNRHATPGCCAHKVSTRPSAQVAHKDLHTDWARVRTPARTSSSTLALPRPSGRCPMSISAAASSRTQTWAGKKKPLHSFPL